MIAPALNARGSRRFGAWLLVFVILVVVGCIRFRLRDMPLDRDEGEYAYAGQLMLDGIPPYALAYNMKFPGTYAAYAGIMAVLGQTPAGIHIGFLVVNLVTILLIFFLGRKLLDDTAGAVAAATFGLMSLSQSVLGLTAHATHFVVLFAAAGLLVLVSAFCRDVVAGEQMPPRTAWLFAAGILFGIATLMKQNGAFFALFGGACCVWRFARSESGGRMTALKGFIWYCIGVATPLLLTGLLLWKTGVFGKFWFWTIRYASEYASENPGGAVIWHRLTTRIPMIIKPALIASVIGLGCLWWRRPSRKTALFATGLLLFSLVSIFPDFHFREHYFVLLMPVLALLTGAAVSELGEFAAERQLSLVSMMPALAFIVLLACGFRREDDLFFRATPLQACRLLYGLSPFPESIPIADYIREHSKTDARVAVIGSEPQIYFYSHRKSATGYIYTYALMEPHPFAVQMQQEMIAEIEAAKPQFLVRVNVPTSWLKRPSSNHLIFDWADRYTAENYELEGAVDLIDMDRVDFHWSAEARTTTLKSPYTILIYNRKQ